MSDDLDTFLRTREKKYEDIRKKNEAFKALAERSQAFLRDHTAEELSRLKTEIACMIEGKSYRDSPFEWKAARQQLTVRHCSLQFGGEVKLDDGTLSNVVVRFFGPQRDQSDLQLKPFFDQDMVCWKVVRVGSQKSYNTRSLARMLIEKLVNYSDESRVEY